MSSMWENSSSEKKGMLLSVSLMWPIYTLSALLISFLELNPSVAFTN